MRSEGFSPLITPSSEPGRSDDSRAPHFELLTSGSGSRANRFESLSLRPRAAASEVLDAGDRQPDPITNADRQPTVAAENADGELRHDRHWIATEELQRQHEAELEALRREHAAEVAILKANDANDRATQIDTAFRNMMSELATAMEMHLVAILGRVMTTEHRRRSIAMLAEKARSIAEDPSIARLELIGPVELIDAFKRVAGDKIDRFSFKPSNGMDLLLAIDDTVLSTRFRDWQQELERVAYE